MKFWIVLLITFFVALKSTQAATFEEANELLRSGKVDQATIAYEALIDQGIRSSAVYANLGRALQQQGSIASASLNYHRALMLNPRLVEAQRGLAELSATTGIPAFAPRWTQSIIERIPSLVLIVFGEIFFWGGAFLLVMMAFRSLHRISALFWSSCLLLIGLVLLGISWFSDPRVANARLAIVTAEKNAAALRQPLETAVQVASLPPGAPIVVLSERGDWDYCRLPTGLNAWISSSSLSFVNPAHISDES